MTSRDQTAGVSGDVPAATPPRPKPQDVPPTVQFDPPLAETITGVPVRLTGTADPGNTSDDQPEVIYTGVEVAVTGGEVTRAWPTDLQWAQWAADVTFSEPGTQEVTATASTSTGRTVAAPHLSVQVGTQTSSDRLIPGQSLQPGQELRVAGQPIGLVLQPNGDLVLYWGAGTFVLWATYTDNSAGTVTQAVMQTDGNFVLYAGSEPVWATETDGNPGAYLVLQPDGELVLFDRFDAPIWRAGTEIVTAPPRAASVLSAPGRLNPGQYLQAPRQPYTCVMQDDGHLVVCKLGSKSLWCAHTDGEGAAYALMQDDGNLVLYTAAQVPVWSSGTDGNPGAYLAMQDDGNLVICRPDGEPIWASNTAQPPPSPYWAIVLCKFNDVDIEPAPRSWYEDYYTNPATLGPVAYWQTVTGGIKDPSGSQLFGWFTMKHSTAELASLTFPADRNVLTEWGREAAQANGVDLSKFKQVLTVLNYCADSGAVGAPGDVVIGTNPDPQNLDLGFVCHEMGHGFGLEHSWSASAGPDMEYGDGFDLMSYNTTTFDFPALTDGVIGWATVGLNAPNLITLGAALDRIAVPSAPSDYSDQLILNALTQSPRDLSRAYLALQIPQVDGSSFTVEARRKAQWDRGLHADNIVVIHQIRPDGRCYLVADFFTGGTFRTWDPAVVVYVGSWNGDQVQIWAWDLPAGALRQELGGDPGVYLMEGGQKRWIVDPATTLPLIQAYTGAVVRQVPAGGLLEIPIGPNISWLNVSAVPHPPPLDVPVQLTVTATDPVTNFPVAGDVNIDGARVGFTGQPFIYTFSDYASGWVKTAGYITTPIDFGFPPPEAPS